MFALSFFTVSVLAVTYSSVIQIPQSEKLHLNQQHSVISPAIRHSQSKLNAIPQVVLGVIATQNSQSDDDKSLLEAGKEIVAKVADKVADVIDDAKDVVDDLISNVRDKVSDNIEKLTDVSISVPSLDDESKTADTKNSSADTTSNDYDNVDDSFDRDGGNSTDKGKSSKQDDDEDDDQNKDSKQEKLYKKVKEDSNENTSDKTNTGSALNGTRDSEENQEHGSQAFDKNKSGSVWSWLKSLTGDEDDDEDDDEKIKKYLAQMWKVKGYLDAIDSSIAASQAKMSGTCPIYPVQVGTNRVTITTKNGCKIIIKLKGVAVDQIENGQERNKTRRTKKSVLVSYASDD